MGKIYDAIMGLVVGDALGVPYEFKKRDTFKATDMVGYGTYNQPVGTWSDDSSLTIATLESFARIGRIDLYDIMYNFYKWYFFGEFTPFGEVFDVGNTTRMAIQRFRYEGMPPEECGGDRIMDNGNGSLMRILPLAFMDFITDDIYRLSAITHAHETSQRACVVYVNIVENLILGNDKREAMGMICKYIEKFSRDEIKSTGYVIDTLEAALWCFLHTDSYRECVLTAVNLGGDTDTIAAVSGGLAGLYYGVGGEKGIPAEWIEKIVKHDMIRDLCHDFSEKFEKGDQA